MPVKMARDTRRRSTTAWPVTGQGKGRKIEMPDRVLRRLELEAIECGEDQSKVVTALLTGISCTST